MRMTATILVLFIAFSFRLGTTGQKIDSVRPAQVDSFFIKAAKVDKKADTLEMRLNRLQSNQVATKVKINYLQSWIDRLIKNYNRVVHNSKREPTPDTVIITEIKVIEPNAVQPVEEEKAEANERRKPFRGIKEFFKKLFP